MSNLSPTTTGSSIGKTQMEHHKYANDSEKLPQVLEDELGESGLDADAAVLRGQNLEFTKEEEKKLRAKIDWRLMPVMALVTGLQFVDKAAIGSAAIFGMRTDLNLQGQDYSWAVAIFYFGFLASLWPSVWAMQKFDTSKFIAVMCVLWGASILAMVGIKNVEGLLALRFLLGVFEAGLAPGFIQITGRFYTQKEQPIRFGLWTLTNGWLPIPALVMYYGLGQIRSGPLAPWRYIFLILGIVTMASGALLYIFVPESPSKATFLNDRQKAIAVERVARSQLGIKNHKFKKEQAIEALTDFRAWLVVATLFFSQSGGAVTTNFLGIVINGFGYSQLRSLLLQTPAFAIQGFICLIVTGLATFTKFFRHKKQLMLACAAACVVTGTAVIYTRDPTPNNRNLLLGMLYMLSLSNCSYTTIMAVIGTNFAGQTKKGTVSSMAFVAYCVSNIVVPQAFRGSEAPTYHSGILTVMCFQIALIICYITSWTLMMLENRRRNKLALDERNGLEGGFDEKGFKREEVMQGLRDLTDRQNVKNFRYSP